MAVTDTSATEARRRFVTAWNDLMVDIWIEQIRKLGVVRTGALLRSPMRLPVRADGRFLELHLVQNFLEYGLWQDLGTGREVARGNSGDIGRAKRRKRRRWYSAKYFRSVGKLSRFLGFSLGQEFKGIIANALRAGNMRQGSAHYKRKGY